MQWIEKCTDTKMTGTCLKIIASVSNTISVYYSMKNKLEYTKIHNDFKNLVEELIGHLLAELGVTQEQFMEAC